jgi:hypothetical protein
MDPLSKEIETITKTGGLWGYVLAHLWVLLLSGFGGVVSYIQKVKTGQCKRFNLTELVGEVVISGFAGAMTYLVCQATGVAPLWSAVLVGVAGHMGARTMLLLEHNLTRRFDLAPPPAPYPAPPFPAPPPAGDPGRPPA